MCGKQHRASRHEAVARTCAKFRANLCGLGDFFVRVRFKMGLENDRDAPRHTFFRLVAVENHLHKQYLLKLLSTWSTTGCTGLSRRIHLSLVKLWSSLTWLGASRLRGTCPILVALTFAQPNVAPRSREWDSAPDAQARVRSLAFFHGPLILCTHADLLQRLLDWSSEVQVRCASTILQRCVGHRLFKRH